MTREAAERRRRYREDPEFRRRKARNDARHKIHNILKDQPDMALEDPEALGHDYIFSAIAEESTHFVDAKEVRRRGI